MLLDWIFIWFWDTDCYVHCINEKDETQESYISCRIRQKELSQVASQGLSPGLNFKAAASLFVRFTLPLPATRPTCLMPRKDLMCALFPLHVFFTFSTPRYRQIIYSDCTLNLCLSTYRVWSPQLTQCCWSIKLCFTYTSFYEHMKT